MESTPRCIACSLRQAINTTTRTGASPRVLREILLKSAALLPKLDMSRPPAHNSTRVLHLIPEMTGCADPYYVEKRDYNKRALALLPRIEAAMGESADPLLTAALTAVAGNVIDLGIATGDIDVGGAYDEVMKRGFAINDIEGLRSELTRPRKVLYLGDNAGEVVFDRALVGLLAASGHAVTFAVHGGPILNDALLEDAKEAGLDGLVPVVSTGSNWVGLELETTTGEFRKLFSEADVVIGKGQGNFETLHGAAHTPPATWFLLKAKCPSVARALGVAFGDVVLKRAPRKGYL